MPDLTYTFEDLPLHREGEFVALRQSGTAVISYDHHGNWRVESISLDADNNRIGSAARGCDLKLDLRRHSTLWKLVDDALSREAHDAIVERILADEPYEDPNAEHRFHAAQLGVRIAMGAL
jgi:hypothetical protein